MTSDTLVGRWGVDIFVNAACVAGRDTGSMTREKQGEEGREGEWLISNRNKILRKRPCCQPELALPYCLALGVRARHTHPCALCVRVQIASCSCTQWTCVHSFMCCVPVRHSLRKEGIRPWRSLRVCFSTRVLVHVCKSTIRPDVRPLHSAPLRSSDVSSGHLWRHL